MNCKRSKPSSIQSRFENNPLFKMHMIVHHMDQMADKVILPRLRLTYNKFLVLMAIHCSKSHETVTQKQVSTFTNLTEATVSRIIDTVIKEGYVQKEIDVNHRSKHILSLTKEGVNIFQKAMDALHNECENLLEGVDSVDRNTVNAVLEHIASQFYS